MRNLQTENGGSSQQQEPIAIIGVAARFPGDANNVEALWDLLQEGRSAFSEFPKDRINADGYYHPDPEHGGTFAVKGGHFLKDDPALFDGGFFNTTKTEVLTLDPQQRILLENVYHALENAGITLERANGSNTSVYVSGFNHDFLSIINSDLESAVKYKPTGSSSALLSNRVSWFFNFQGPSITLDTACSSSMVALHLACQSLAAGESTMAIAAGVSTMLTPLDTLSMGHHGFLSPEGRCFSFDHRADGYGRGEGVGSIILKRLSDAVRDGDTIRAVVCGSGVNQDGRTPGITLPSASAQEKLIRQVYHNAGLKFDETAMVEAHGTGTAAGDPIEAGALAKAFSSSDRKTSLVIGAMKSAIGHLEGGAGIASIIKSICVLESGIIPPNANFEKINPKIPATKWNMDFPTKCLPWPNTDSRRISVNSFGVGGTNSHAVLEDAYSFMRKNNMKGRHATNSTISQLNGHTTNGYPNGAAVEAKTKPSYVFNITAFDENGISRNATRIGQYLGSLKRSEPGLLQDLAYTLLEKRTKFSWRSFVVANSVTELTQKLSETSSISKPIRAGKPPRIGFVFTGQGAQWAGMGTSLLIHSVFRESLQAATLYLKSLGAKWSLIEELKLGKDRSRIGEAHLAQPLCTALQVALVELLTSWGITARRVVGHSSGEIAAAFCAGKISREDAWKASYFRGIVSSKAQAVKGSMAVASIGADALRPFLEKAKSGSQGDVTIACYNSPKNHTLSGNEGVIDRLVTLLTEQNIWVRKLKVSNAYHSSLMECAADEYLTTLQHDIKIKAGDTNNTAMISTVTGSEITTEDIDSDYWVQNLLSPVRFTEALSYMCFQKPVQEKKGLRLNAGADDHEIDIIIELGPHSAMQSAVKEILSSHSGGSQITYLPTIKRDESVDSVTFLQTVGELSCRGLPVDFSNGYLGYASTDNAPKLLVHLPGYVFDHSERIWHESRLSKNLRTRKYPRHDLLGAPVIDWNQELPKWRHVIRLSEQPWLRDHIVTNSVVYPGVGYIIAIVEACRQLADPDSTLTGFRLKHIAFKRALIIPDTREGVETSVTLSRMDESSLVGSTTWQKFQFLSYNPSASDWVEHCTGYISVEYTSANITLDGGKEQSLGEQNSNDELKEVEHRCSAAFNFSHAYENLVTAGLNFGPLFRNLKEVKGARGSEGEVLGVVEVPDIVECMPKRYAHPHLIHPATMDSMVHLFIASMMNLLDRNTLDRAYVPSFIKNLWISADLSCKPTHRYLGHGKASVLAFDKYQSDVTIWDEGSRKKMISFEGIRASPLDSTDTSQARKLCHKLEWVPDVDLLTNATFPAILSESQSSDIEYKYWIRQLQTASLILITDALAILRKKARTEFEGHRGKYFSWMLHLEQLLNNDKVTGMRKADWHHYSSDPKHKADLFTAVEKHNADGKLAIRMGSNIVPILNGEVDPLHLMFQQDDLLDHVYREVVKLGDLPAYQHEYFSLVGESTTNIKILEIGAGTGSSTAIILDALSSSSTHPDVQGRTNVLKYTFTDISAGFFEKAKERFSENAGVMEYRVLDIEKDPGAQGFTNDYDFVVAGNVIHATENLVKTLSNARKLLKPTGRLVLQEGVRQDFFWSAIAFGHLPGWWLGTESSRKWSPWVSSSEWNHTLTEAGFGGIDLELADRKDPDLHSQSIVVASATPVRELTAKDDNVVIVTNDCKGQLEIQLRDLLIKSGASCTVVPFQCLTKVDLRKALCISTIELHKPFLYDIPEAEYATLRWWLCQCQALLWITGDNTKLPELNMITGLTRSVRWERDLENANLTTLSVVEPQPSRDQLVSLIKAMVVHLKAGTSRTSENSEYKLKNGLLLTARLFESENGNSYLADKFVRAQPVLQEWGTIERPVKLVTASPGLLNKLEFTTDPIYDVELEPTQIEIKIEAVGLNFRDLMIAMGEHMAYSLGSEGAGVVSRIGSQVSTVSVGDHVTYMCGIMSTGCLHTYGRVDEKIVGKISKTIPFEIAASLPVIFATALYGLRDIARLKEGESVLIHAAAGGVGQAAVQYANLVGAEVFATCSTPEKRSLLIEQYGVQEDHIFSSRDLTFVEGVKRMTNGRGVDVILNSLAGEALRRSWDLVAPFGRFIEIGKKDAQLNGKIDLEPFLRNVTMASVELPTMMKYQPALVKRLIDDTINLYRDGRISAPTPIIKMNYSQIEEGFRLLQSGKGMGKIIFKPESTDLVSVIPQKMPPLRLDNNATYVLAGGLGGIGRSLAIQFAALGAKSLVFLSRSGKISDTVKELLQTLELKGCAARIFACDVSDSTRLAEVVAECRQSLPLIKGCVQGSMVLEDGMFENMSYAAFQTAVKPKVQGSWNLHNLLPKTLDFFLLLSSGTGILGNRAQANYATGNTYQDALAAHRHSLGLAASVLDLGTVLSVGYVAENLDRTMMARHLGTILEVLREDEIHALVEYLIDPRSKLNEKSCQLTAGLTDLSMYKQRGIPPPTYLSYPLFTHLNAESTALAGQSGDGSPAFATQALLAAAQTMEEVHQIMLEGIHSKLSSLLAIPMENIDVQKSVSSNGVDSLVAMEFRTFLVKDLLADVPLLEVMGTMSLEALSKRVVGISKWVQIEEKGAANGV